MFKIKNINKILDVAIKKNASDIHLTNNINPVLRVDGELEVLSNIEVSNKELLRTYTKELFSEVDLESYKKNKYLDGSFQYKDSRFRVHIYRQMESDAIALRLIPTEIPSFSELNLPLSLRKFTNLESGLVLIVGVTGSGKSTTLAAIIDEINNNYKKHIITVENPVEFVHSHKKSIINQREVGLDVIDFSDAVKSAMREDPDILLVGELRDLETIRNAITMAETGHLVFGTLHTRSAAETVVDRLIDVFPPNQQDQVRIQLSNSIQGIVSQELLPKVGGGKVPCCEVMFATDAIRSLIREQASPNSIIDQMLMSSRKIGSQTKVQSLANLVVNGLITREVALSKVDSSDIENLNKMIISMSK